MKKQKPCFRGTQPKTIFIDITVLNSPIRSHLIHIQALGKFTGISTENPFNSITEPSFLIGYGGKINTWGQQSGTGIFLFNP